MSNDVKQNLKSQSTWMRGLYMLLYIIFSRIAEIVLGVVVLFQFLLQLFTGETNERLLKLGITFSMFHGDTKDRQEQINMFQSGAHKVFVGQEATGGMGITLTAANYMVYYENNFSLEDRKQSEDRIHRIGQEHKCTYIDLCYNGTMDNKILKAIQSKQDIATYLVDSFKEGNYATQK